MLTVSSHNYRRLTLLFCAILVAAAAIMHVDLASSGSFQRPPLVSSNVSEKPDAAMMMERCHTCAVPGDIAHPAIRSVTVKVRAIPAGRELALIAFVRDPGAPPPKL